MRSKFVYAVLILTAVTAFPGRAMALSSYLNTFNTTYGTSGTALNTCNLCHPGGNTLNLNAYASDFAAKAHNFKSIESLDSDKDGFTNIQEIQARTFPGDATSKPASAVTLSSIAISGPASVNMSATGTYTATATYSDGTSKAVTPTWSLGSTTYATISAAGVLTAKAVTANQTATVNASYTEGSATKTATQSVTIAYVAPAVTLSSIAISGPASVNMNSTGTYTATATYSDGTSKAVTPTWSLSSTTYATISATGVLTAKAVTANQTVTVNASYTEGSATKTATQSVTIAYVAPTVTLSSIAISGPASVNMNSTGTYTATATYSDGTSKAVTPTWSLSSTTYATISAAGVLTSKAVTANQTVTVNASYTEGSATKTATQSVTIAYVAPAVTLSSIAISGPASVNMNSTGTYTATATYSDGTSKAVTPTWSLSSTTYATISAAGVLTAKAVTANQTVTVNAGYTEGSVTKTATKSVTIVFGSQTVTLTGLAISGPSSVKEGSLVKYTANASYSDGTSKAVTPTWSLGSKAYAYISTAGAFTAKAVTANQTVTVNASYTENGITQTASQNVTIVHAAPAASAQLLYFDDFSTCTAAGCPNWQKMSGVWGAGDGAFHSVEKYNDSALVKNFPALDQWVAGRLESKMFLTGIIGPASSTGVNPQPNAMFIFGYQDSSHYRYVWVGTKKVMIGQIGDFDGTTHGVVAVANVSIPLNQWHHVQVDVYPTGGVHVYLNPPANGTAPKAITSYGFTSAVPGRVGYLAARSRSIFDDFTAWDDTVPPTPEPSLPN